MSYIRALSNPEAMYAYASDVGVCISANTLVDRHGNHIELRMPVRDFEGLFRKWEREMFSEYVRFRGASLAEIPAEKVSMRTGPIPLDAFRFRLSHTTWGEQSIVAYKVTWCYVAQNARGR